VYDKTITVFSRKKQGKDTVWYATVMDGVSITDTVVESENGQAREHTGDNVRVVVRTQPESDGTVFVSGKEYLNPKEWNRADAISDSFSLKSGSDFDFFIYGDYDEFDGAKDSLYEPNGFYQYMRKNYDRVYVISSVALFTVLPHFEIGGR